MLYRCPVESATIISYPDCPEAVPKPLKVMFPPTSKSEYTFTFLESTFKSKILPFVFQTDPEFESVANLVYYHHMP